MAKIMMRTWMRGLATCGAAAAGLLALTSGASAKPKDNTLLLGDLGDGSKLWLMLDSVRQDEGSIRHGWSVIDYSTRQTIRDIGFQSDASKFYVNCDARQVILVNAIKFDGRMGSGKNVLQAKSEPTPEPKPEEYHLINPGTAEDAVATAICKQKIR
jgi:hypothetical protein